MKINLEKIKKLSLIGSLVLAATLSGCAKKTDKNNDLLQPVTTLEDMNNIESTEEVETIEKETETISVIDKTSKLTVENFDEFVDSVETLSNEAGYRARREDLEVATYLINIGACETELNVEKDNEYSYNGQIDEQFIINKSLETITSLASISNGYYFGNTENKIDLSKLCVDEIDKEIIQELQNSVDGFYTMANSDLEIAKKQEETEKFLEQMENFMLESGKINGYTKENLTEGGLLVAKLYSDISLDYIMTFYGSDELGNCLFTKDMQDRVNFIENNNMVYIYNQLLGSLGYYATGNNFECEESTLVK